MDGISTLETISGTVEEIVYKNETNDYTVFQISINDELVTAVGEIPMLTEGERVVLYGTWTFHKEFGKQFVLSKYEKYLPNEIDGIIQYLSSRSVKGVGPVTALKIVNKFGLDTFNIIENHPEWLADIPGITLKKAATISESFREQAGFRNVMMFFKDYASVGEISKMYKKLGGDTIGIVKENPYILCDTEYGISFETADKIAMSLGHNMMSKNRIFTGLEYILSYNGITNGHTCLPEEKLLSATAQMLNIEKTAVSQTLEELIVEEAIASYQTENDRLIMSSTTDENERFVAAKIRSMCSDLSTFSQYDISSMIEEVEAYMGIEYAHLQRLALFRALENGVSILTGGPGTGKTTVVRAMITLFNGIGRKVVLCAPTGRAAKRLSEATGHEAKTIHRLLEMERRGGFETVFNRDSRNPLDEDVVIADEASMIDLSLITALLRAMKRGARLILIGDSDQLPSVGAGNVLADFIASGVISTVCLKEIFRQSEKSLIISNAHRINAGITPLLGITDNDFFFVNREDERLIPSTISSLITERLPRSYGRDISSQIQVISPSRKGPGGVETLNMELQARINPPGKFKREKAAHGTIFREGDKVMQNTNNYELRWEKAGYEGIGIFNGDVGVIERIDPSEEKMLILFDERRVEYPFENLEELELAYAITVHKSQGSEYPVVIIPMYYCAPMLLTRNLLYTAVTRAKKMVILVGRADIPGRMVQNNRETLRYTTLAERLAEN